VKTDLDIRILKAGYCKHPQIMTIRDGRLRPIQYDSLSFILTHPVEGPIIFDTGYDPAFMQATRKFPERFYAMLTPVTLSHGEEITTQLRTRNIDPLEIKHIVLSHFHADHMSGLHAFKHAKIHCSKAGLSAACTGGNFSAVRQGVPQSQIPDARIMDLPSDFLPFTHATDILGDGSVLAVELPGHCPGHWGLAFREPSGAYHFLVADAAWSTDAIRRNMPPPILSTSFLGSTKRTRKTLSMLSQLHKRNPDMKLSPSHCPECAGRAEPIV